MSEDPQFDGTDIPPPPPRLEQRKHGGNHMFTSPRNQTEREAWAAARWAINGWTLQEIAQALDLKSSSSAHAYVQRGLRATRGMADATSEQARSAPRARL